MATTTKRRVKKKSKTVFCGWCRKKIRLGKNGRLVAHDSVNAENWQFKEDPSRCPGSGVDPKNWEPKPVDTHPQAKKKPKRKRKKVKK